MALYVSNLFKVIQKIFMVCYYVPTTLSHHLQVQWWTKETNISAFVELTGKCVREGGKEDNKTVNKILVIQDNYYEGHYSKKEKAWEAYDLK